MKILILHHPAAQHIGTVAQHLGALRKVSAETVDLAGPIVAGRLSLDGYDAVIVHYSLDVTLDKHLPPAMRDRLARFKGRKLAFVQDEYRHVEAEARAIAELGIDTLFSVIPDGMRQKIYKRAGLPDGVQIEKTLAGFAPQEWLGRKTPRYVMRPIRLGYRGRELPAWMGSLAAEKTEIALQALRRAPKDWRIDIETSERKRLYGERWPRWLASCRAVLGTESGASAIDFADEKRKYWEDFRMGEPYLYDTPGYEIRTISPRVFEAAALRTLLVLYEGHYEGIIEPWRHYVPLKKTWSNWDDVARFLQSPKAVDEMLQEAWSRAHAAQLAPIQLTRHVERVLGIRPIFGRRRKPSRRLDALALAERGVWTAARHIAPYASPGIRRRAKALLRMR